MSHYLLPLFFNFLFGILSANHGFGLKQKMASNFNIVYYKNLLTTQIIKQMKTIKSIVCAGALLISGPVIIYAATPGAIKNDNYEIAVKKGDPSKKEIDPASLPAAVKESIMDGDFSEWSIDKAYEVTFDDGKGEVEYEIHFINMREEKEIERYNKEGEELDDDD